jgi:hypothetical protein
MALGGLWETEWGGRSQLSLVKKPFQLDRGINAIVNITAQPALTTGYCDEAVLSSGG